MASLEFGIAGDARRGATRSKADFKVPRSVNRVFIVASKGFGIKYQVLVCVCVKEWGWGEVVAKPSESTSKQRAAQG